VTLNNAKNAFTTLKERQDHNHLDFVLINKFKIAILRIPEKRHLKNKLHWVLRQVIILQLDIYYFVKHYNSFK